MIPVAVGVRIWIATGHTDMRKGMHGLRCWCRKVSAEIRSQAMSLCSAADPGR
jgi:hypothetical protein